MFNPFRRRTEDHPTAVERVRVDPRHIPAHFPVGSLRDSPTTRRELAPQPPAYSAFDTVGKRAPEIIRPVTTLSMAEWLSVCQWPFAAGRPLVPMRILGAPHQGMTPFVERVNIESPPQTSLGAQTSIKAPQFTGPQYGKLGVFI